VNPYAVALTRTAERELGRLPSSVARRVAAAIDGLEQNPRPRGATKLVGSVSTYRIRVGEYRVIYEVDDESRSVLVTRVRHRKDAYQ
jgi:mRNA interferase RelE/StbE